jgi:hypothetical protein
MKQCETSLVMKKIQIKTTKRNNFVSTRMAILNKGAAMKVGEQVEKLEFLCTASGIVEWYGHFEEQSVSSLKV